MRWLFAFYLLLSGCVVAGPPRQVASSVQLPPRPELGQLQQAIQSYRLAENRLPLDAFIDGHSDDSWGQLARHYRQQAEDHAQQRRELKRLRKDSEALASQNQALQQELKTLQSQLDELTRSLIEQETRQP